MKRDNESGAGHRLPRLESHILEELGSLLRDDVEDPAVDGVGLTAVSLSPDYKNARVHFVIAKGTQRDVVERGLQRATPFLRRRLAEAIELKRTPDLRFVFEAEVSFET